MQMLATYLTKLQRYCAYQERCKQEVRQKLRNLGVQEEAILVEVIRLLEADNFLNEQRFAKHFAWGKFSFKKWGRNKIRHELQKKQITTIHIQIALQEIEETDYLQTLKDLIDKKNKSLNAALSSYERKQKIARFLLQKGYEQPLIWQQINICLIAKEK